MRAIAEHTLAGARAAITDPECSSQEAVHEFRRVVKEWRALMRLLAPFIGDADRWQIEARDHARSLAQARDGQAALNAFNDLIKSGIMVSERTAATIRGRVEELRAGEEGAVLTPELRGSIIRWLDSAAAAVEQWPLDSFHFSAIAAQLSVGYRKARRRLPADWPRATPEQLHAFRQRVVDHRYQMELVEPLWPRFARMWTEEAERVRNRLGKCQDLSVLERFAGPHQPLAHWRSQLVPTCAERRAELSRRAARIARRLFAEKPKTFRRRLEALWQHGR
ncbi:MAG: CHAD domain-containing protein [Xanthobacteraceae bacterium]